MMEQSIQRVANCNINVNSYNMDMHIVRHWKGFDNKCFSTWHGAKLGKSGRFYE